MPTISEACAKDASRRLIIDVGTEWGKVMLSQLLAAQAAGKAVLLGSLDKCISQTATGNSWVHIEWMQSLQ